MNKPLVSICSITYNHAPYIRQCLDGFLMQQTTFPIEIIINDDCSTDGTTEIIHEYAEKYPDLIFPIFHEENQYQKGVRGMFQRFVFPKARGKYIALCEGDDYWTDPLKLQKQVDFLEANPEYSLCFHNVEVRKEYGGKTNIDLNFYDAQGGQDYTAVDLIMRWIIPTCSVLFRKECVFEVPENANFKVGDNVLFLTCAKHGKIRCLVGYMAVYRRNLNGVSIKGGAALQCRNLITHYEALKESFPFLPRERMDAFILTRYVDLLKISVRDKLGGFFQILSEIGKKYGARSVIKVIKELFFVLLRKIR